MPPPTAQPCCMSSKAHRQCASTEMRAPPKCHMQGPSALLLPCDCDLPIANCASKAPPDRIESPSERHLRGLQVRCRPPDQLLIRQRHQKPDCASASPKKGRTPQ